MQQVLAEVLAAGRHFFGGIVELGLAVKAEARHVAGHGLLADVFGDLRVDGVDGFDEAFGEGQFAVAGVVVVG